MAALDPRRALFPGTFDPVTLGHLDVLERARARFDEVIVAVAVHPTKKALFGREERVELIRAAAPGVRVVTADGLVVDTCREHGCGTIVRGVRRGGEFDYEVGLALGNRHLDSGIDTVLFIPDPTLAHVTSSLVREIAGLGGETKGMVPEPVLEALARKFGE
ncbi:MAG: pantetheine-phosphate adenylyltransferase [Planctomycetota bacterium]